jgi:2-dehydropantoate 2-reductase
VGEAAVIGGPTYIATALSAPGLIEQTGTHRRIVFGEVFGALPRMTDRVRRIHEALAGADIQAEAVEDGRVPIWEKFIFLVSLAGFTGAARLPIGPVWADSVIRAQFLEGCREVEQVARAEGVPVAQDIIQRIATYIEAIPGTMRSSLLIDLSQGKRIEVCGRAPRRSGRRAGADHVDTVCGAEAVGTPTRLTIDWNRGCCRSFLKAGVTFRKTHAPARASTRRSIRS